MLAQIGYRARRDPQEWKLLFKDDDRTAETKATFLPHAPPREKSALQSGFPALLTSNPTPLTPADLKRNFNHLKLSLRARPRSHETPCTILKPDMGARRLSS